MFSWICPQCGREVPPAYSECPDCSGQAQAPAPQPPALRAPVAAPAAPPVQPQYSPRPAVPPLAQPPAAAPEYFPPTAAPAQPGVQYVYVKQTLPAWLVTLLVAMALIIVGGASYYLFFPSARERRQEPEAAAPSPFEAPQESTSAAAPSPVATALAKHLEVTGLRLFEEKKRSQVRFVVVNHSTANMAGLQGNLTLRASEPGSKPIAVIPFTIDAIGPLESREITAALKTSLRAYELPDWQFLKADLELTAP